MRSASSPFRQGDGIETVDLPVIEVASVVHR
jgi:hypothetical protein